MFNLFFVYNLIQMVKKAMLQPLNHEDQVVTQTRHCLIVGNYNDWLVVWNILLFSMYWECHTPN
jgi:hypothetical protein